MQAPSMQTFSKEVSFKLNGLAETIEKVPLGVRKSEIGYLVALNSIYFLMKPLFERIAHMSIKPGCKDAEQLSASPKASCEHFVFAVKKSEKITEIILTQNIRNGFLVHGLSKPITTRTCELFKEACLNGAQERFLFSGTAGQVEPITIESESGKPIFHWVKGVNIILISPNQAEKLKLNEKITNKTLLRLPVDEFLIMSENDKIPMDCDFDRKWIARAIRAYNSNQHKENGFEQYWEREITKEDKLIAEKANEWIKNVRVNQYDLDICAKIIQNFIATELKDDVTAEGASKSSPNSQAIITAAQRVVDALVARLLPAWTYENNNYEEIGCQFKVSESVPVFVNGTLLPSFFTIPQMVAFQGYSLSKQRFRIFYVDRSQGYVNIFTQ